MMKTTGLLVVFTLFVILYQTSAVPVASSYKLENENVMDVMEAKEKSEEASDDEKAKEDDEEADKEEEKSDEDKKEDDVKNEDEEEKEDEDKKDDEESREDEDNKEEKEEKEEDKEEEPDLNEQENDQESSGEENVDLDSDHLVLQGSGNGKIKGVVIEDSDKEKDKPEKRSIDDDKKPSKSTQGLQKRQYGYGCGGGCGYDYLGHGGCCAGCDWCGESTGGFGLPKVCGSCNNGGCPTLTYPCVFGANCNNPACECCKEPPKPGECKWPCMWPCVCKCTPPKFEFEAVKAKPTCHCPVKDCHAPACGHHVKRSRKGPVKRSLLNAPVPNSYGYAPIFSPLYNHGAPTFHFPRGF